MITLLSRMTRKGFHAAADGVNLPLWRSLFKPAGLLFGGDNTGAADGAGVLAVHRRRRISIHLIAWSCRHPHGGHAAVELSGVGTVADQCVRDTIRLLGQFGLIYLLLSGGIIGQLPLD